MPISLTTRASNGAPLSATIHDANLTEIEDAFNALETTVTDGLDDLDNEKLDTIEFDLLFEPTVGGKKQILWSNVISRPEQLTTPSLFRGVKTDSGQTVSATGGFYVNFPTESYDIGSDFAVSSYVAPVAGIYSFGSSVQVELVSGTPTDVGILVRFTVNAAVQDEVTLDNTGTGTRIYKNVAQLQLAAGDIVKVYTDFTFTGTATWQVAPNNTYFWGKLEHAL